MVCCWPTMPKRGAVMSATRRSMLVGAAGDERMQRRGQAECGGIGRNVVNAAVGDQKRTADAIGRHIGERRRQRREKLGAVGLAVGLAASTTRVSMPLMAFSLLRRSSRASFGFPGALAELLARALVDDHGDDRRQRLAIFARKRRVGEREQDQREREHAGHAAAGARQQQQRRNHDDRDRSDPQDRGWEPAARRRCRTALLS